MRRLPRASGPGLTVRADAFRWFTRGAALALGAALTVAMIYIFLLGMPVVILVFIALLLASALEPLVDSIRTRTPLRRGATLLLVYLVFFLGLAALVLLVVPGAINQFGDIGARATPLLANAHAWAETLEPKPVSVALIGLIDSLQKAIQPSAVQAPPPDQLLQLGFTAAEALISIVSVLTIIYFWLTERARLQRFALALVPAGRRGGTREAWNQIELRLGGWVRAELILMGFVGVTTTIAYFLIGLQGPLLLGLIAALCEAIPLVGPAIGAIPALVVAALTGDVQTVILRRRRLLRHPARRRQRARAAGHAQHDRRAATARLRGHPGRRRHRRHSRRAPCGASHHRHACRHGAPPGARVARSAQPREATAGNRGPCRRRGTNSQLTRSKRTSDRPISSYSLPAAW